MFIHICFKVNVEQGAGKLVQSQPFSDQVYKRVLARDNVKLIGLFCIFKI